MSGDADDHDHIDANGSVPFSLPGPPRTASIPATSGSDLTSPSEGDVYTFPDSLLSRLLEFDDRVSSLVGIIALWVARSMLRGDLKPGDDLSSVKLAHRFNTGRTPAREALVLLANDGLVEVPARRRSRVATLDTTTVEEIYRLRAHLQSLTVRRAAELADKSDLATLAINLERMISAAEAQDLDSFFWANVAFHERETDAARDATLKRMLDSLGLRVLLLRYQTMSLQGWMSASLEDHQRLLRAYEERDAKLASVLAPAIIEGAYRSLISSGWPSAEATA